MKPSHCQIENRDVTRSASKEVGRKRSITLFAFSALLPALIGHFDDTSMSDESMLPARSAAAPSRLGVFLRQHIEERVERVSGRDWTESAKSKLAQELSWAIAEASEEQGIDPFLLIAMVEVESRYNVNALGRHGEIGLVQIKPSTANWIVPESHPLHGCDLHEVRCNIVSGSYYLQHLTKRLSKAKAALSDERSPASDGTSAHLADVDDRLHILRSYNEGPARADRLSFEKPDPVPYALKIAGRADRFRTRFIDSVVGPMTKTKRVAGGSENNVTSVALNQ